MQLVFNLGVVLASEHDRKCNSTYFKFLQITIIFVAYGIVSELFQTTSVSSIVISLNFFSLLHHIAMVIICWE